MQSRIKYCLMSHPKVFWLLLSQDFDFDTGKTPAPFLPSPTMRHRNSRRANRTRTTADGDYRGWDTSCLCNRLRSSRIKLRCQHVSIEALLAFDTLPVHMNRAKVTAEVWSCSIVEV